MTIQMLTYSIYHHMDLSKELESAKKIAEWAAANKRKKKFSTAELDEDLKGLLPTAISNQILKKYGNNTKIKDVKSALLIIPNKSFNYDPITSTLRIVFPKYKFDINLRWNSGRNFSKINQIEISSKKIYLMTSIEVPNEEVIADQKIIGVDLNATGHIAVVASLGDGKVYKLGKSAPNIKRKYFNLRKNAQTSNNKTQLRELGHREHNILKDLDHKISSNIIKIAKKHKSRIVMENISNIRNRVRRENNKRGLNRCINSWSFYRLRSYVEYKAKLNGIPFSIIDPHYTSQECSHCRVIGNRDKKLFTCTNRNCGFFGKPTHADVNAGFNIAKRYIDNNH